MNEMYINLLKAGTTIFFLLLVDFIIEFLLIRNIKEKRKSIKLRVSVRYVLFFCFLFFMAKIWVEGFGYLLTVVGVISAALTITQKEYLMNIFGWFIIMWRDLFVEGDYIEVGKHRGYVRDMGPLYFTIEEASDVIWGEKSGRIVKIPNSLISNHPILNFSHEHAFVEARFSLIFTFKSSLEKIQDLIPQLEAMIDKEQQTLHDQWSSRHQKEFARLKANLTSKPQSIVRIFQDKPSGVQVMIKYLTLKRDQRFIEDKLVSKVMSYVQAHEELGLSVAT